MNDKDDSPEDSVSTWSSMSDMPAIFVHVMSEDDRLEANETSTIHTMKCPGDRMSQNDILRETGMDCQAIPLEVLHNSPDNVETELVREEMNDPSGQEMQMGGSPKRSITENGVIPNQQAITPSHKNLSQYLLCPPSTECHPQTPKPIRRCHSARNLNEMVVPSPRVIRRTFSPAVEPTPSIYGDSISVINVPITNEMTQKEKAVILKRNLSKLLSGIYAMLLVIIGVIMYVSDQHGEKIITEIFSSTISGLGILWLIFLHYDLCQYKKEVLRELKQRENAMQENHDRFSTGTEYIFNSGFEFNAMKSNESASEAAAVKLPPYLFMQGRHSGSFYLKIGMAAFCFGNLIYDGLQLGQHILNFIDNAKKQFNCSRPSSVVLHVMLPLHAFYQLFVTFKYSNIIINRHKALARFGLMHLIATCLCFWFNTIIEEAVEDYNQKSGNSTLNTTNMEFNIASYHVIVIKGKWVNPFHCTAESALSVRSMAAIPYLYPFAIEYNLLLAGIWFIVWQNIGVVLHPSDPQHLRHTISQDEGGGEAIAYQSNLVINADCHAANKGLFVGLFVMLTTIVTVIVFFVAMTTEGYQERAVSIHTGQEGGLTLIGLLAVVVCFFQMKQLDLNRNPITLLDDVLLFIPLPFYFVHGMMSIMAEYGNKSFTRLAVHILVTLQVVVQTPFIIDGLRRCSNSQVLRYKKPGREVITFLIILNLTLWIVNTFELKSVEKFHAQEEYFGDFIWMFIGHTTLPLMLFYRFHSSVCLSDIWKSAYDKENL